MAARSDIHPGTLILLKDDAVQPWARGMVFVVDEVRGWGVTCLGGEGLDIPMRAAWADIERVLPAELN